MKRLICASLIALLVAAGTVLTLSAATSAESSETCVGLYDRVQASQGAGAHVGVYQRLHGDQAEAACRVIEQASVRTALAWAFGESDSQSAAVGWPTTCVGLNDLLEAHRGASGSVGIYQRSFGEQAEAACQRDHLARIQSAFTWAGPGTMTIGAPSGAPRNLDVKVKYACIFVSVDPPANQSQSVLGYRWTVSGATTRTGGFLLGNRAAPLHIARLNPGEHTLTIQALNAQGAGPALSRSFVISHPSGRDPVMQQALDLLWTLPTWDQKLERPEVQAANFVFETPAVSGAWATYSLKPNAVGGLTPTVSLHPDLRQERLPALAATLAHEVTHIISDYPETKEQCFQCEIDATMVEARVWWQLMNLSAPLQTEFERRKHADYVAWREGVLPTHVRDTYEGQCGQFGDDKDD